MQRLQAKETSNEVMSPSTAQLQCAEVVLLECNAL